MSIVAIIGVDQVGKTTLINKLKQNYDIDTLAFPTSQVRKELEGLKVDYTDIHSILNYHMRFQLDFMENQDKICDYYHEKKLLILDRYFYCSLAYLRQAVLRHYLEDYWKYTIRPLFYAHYQINLIQPDYIIWLKRECPDPEDEEIQRCYYEELYDWDDYNGDSIRYESIEGLKKDTYSRVEELLKERRYI